MPISAEVLKHVMRQWPSGIAIVSSAFDNIYHGLTANSFTSVSITPPVVSVAINSHTRTYQMISDAGYFGITILAEGQEEIAERFAGKFNGKDRFTGLDTFTLMTGAPFIFGGVANLDCRVIYSYELPDSTIFLGEVVATQLSNSLKPLVYYNREYKIL